MMAGNAIRLILTPPAGASRWRVLRRTADTFSGHDDAGAVLVHDGRDNNLIDTQALVNGVAYFYRAYWFDGTAWNATLSVSVTPEASVIDWSADVLTKLRERLAAGLAVEVAKGTLRHSRNLIQVLNAPPLADSVTFPVVTIRLQSETPSEHGIGDDIPGFVRGDDTYLEWGESEGWLSRVTVEICGWSLNPDERLEMRKAIRRIVLANQPVFDDYGWVLIELEQRDQDDFEQFNAPVYQTFGTFSCTAPAVVVGDPVTTIRDIPVTVNSIL